MLEDLIARGVPYSAVRDDIAPGDLLLLHHEFVATWYGIKIEAVQRFTGPFAHIAVFDRVPYPDRERVKVYESVMPDVRDVLLSATAQHGFFWVQLNRPMRPAEREQALRECGVNKYDQLGAIAAGAGQLPPDEDARPRRWCAKAAALWRRLSDTDLGPSHVPTEQALVATNRFNARIRYVTMTSGAPA